MCDAAAGGAGAELATAPFDDDAHMREALAEADLAAARHEVPVGAVFVDVVSRAVVARGHNLTNNAMNGARHAELVAIEALMASEGPAVAMERLRRCRLYVTLEPCVMCASALAKVGVASVAFGAWNDKFGGTGSVLALHDGWHATPASAAALSAAVRRSPHAGRPGAGTGAAAVALGGVGLAAAAAGGESDSAAAGRRPAAAPWHRYPVVGGVMKAACIDVLKRFYEAGEAAAASGAASAALDAPAREPTVA